MTAVTRHRRTGLTLTEVLVAMFVMALGLISLLTLFPLGALQIGAALRDDRCAQTATQADAFLRAYWQARVVEPLATNPPGLPADEFFWAMDDPNLAVQRRPNTSTTTTTAPTAELTMPTGILVNQYVQPSSNGANLPTGATPTNSPVSSTTIVGDKYQKLGSSPMADPKVNTGTSSSSIFYVTTDPSNRTAAPSYPVFIDPLNLQAKSNSGGAVWVGYTSGGTQLLVPRRGLRLVTATNVIERCSLIDDLTFDTNGTPLQTGSTITRDGRYNWTAVVQHPSNNRRAVANLTILVFDGRPPLLNTPDTEVVVPLNSNSARTAAGWAAGRSSVTDLPIPAGSNPDAPSVVRRGGWLMDGSVSQGGLRNAHFYRIVGLTDKGNNKYDLDIDPPIRASSNTNTEPTTLYFFAGLAEVFVRAPLVPNPTPGQ